MTHEIQTEITIAASAERVWEVLTDFPSHPQWNPFVRRIEGDLREGAQLTVQVQPPGGKGMTFRPTVLRVKAKEELRWRGRFLIPGLFDGEHYFQIRAVAANQVQFLHGERFSGLLIGLAKSGLNTGTKAGFEAMNRALRARAEGR